MKSLVLNNIFLSSLSEDDRLALLTDTEICVPLEDGNYALKLRYLNHLVRAFGLSSDAFFRILDEAAYSVKEHHDYEEQVQKYYATSIT